MSPLSSAQLRLRSAPLTGWLLAVSLLLANIRLLFVLGWHSGPVLTMLLVDGVAAGLLLRWHVHIIVRADVLCLYFPFRWRRHRTYLFALPEVVGITARTGLLTSLTVSLGAGRNVRFVFLSPARTDWAAFRRWLRAAGIRWPHR